MEVRNYHREVMIEIRDIKDNTEGMIYKQRVIRRFEELYKKWKKQK